MAALFKNRYRIESIRLKGWDYRWNAAYFITICTADRKHYFGEIIKGNTEYSPVGVIADILWHGIPQHAPYVQMGEFVVMPNHIHGILILNNSEIPKEENDVERKENDSPGNHSKDKDLKESAQPLHATTPLDSTKNPQMAKISPKANSISAIIRSYKSATTKHAHRLGFEFAWQTRFYDIIIRNDRSFQKISNYIKNNPANWKEDIDH